MATDRELRVVLCCLGKLERWEGGEYGGIFHAMERRAFNAYLTSEMALETPN